MIRHRFVLLPISLFAWAACSQQPPAETEARAAGPASQPAVTRTEALGETVDPADYELINGGVHIGPAVPVADVLDAPAEYTGKGPLRLEGEIVAVCQNRGCWADVGEPDRTIHVTFAAGCAEYFAKDAAGRTVLLEGALRVETRSVEDQRHLLEDAGKPEQAAAVTEPVQVLSFVATGAAVAK